MVTPETLGAYSCLKQSLLSRYTQTDIAKCFRFIDHPPLGDRHVLTLFFDMQALLPADANTLFNAHFLRCLPESMQNALVGKGEPPPFCRTRRWQPQFRSIRPCRCRRRRLRS